MSNSKNQSNDYTIDIEQILGHPLNFVMANTQCADYDSYLFAAPGELIYQIYDTYGQKLLEQNVRTFLQFKTKTNQGLRTTLTNRPEMFFAYNNGLTATATGIKFTEDKKIKSITGLQIVNGGQTTSAIYAVKRNDKCSLEKVYVQVKLSVIKKKAEDEELYNDEDDSSINDFVSKISEYANTQNHVKKSDFFSNSSFHKNFKQHSERIYAPAKNSYYKTKWFYERARGQYLQSIAILKSKSEQNNSFIQTDVIDIQILSCSVKDNPEVGFLERKYKENTADKILLIKMKVKNKLNASVPFGDIPIETSLIKDSQIDHAYKYLYNNNLEYIDTFFKESELMSKSEAIIYYCVNLEKQYDEIKIDFFNMKPNDIFGGYLKSNKVDSISLR